MDTNGDRPFVSCRLFVAAVLIGYRESRVPGEIIFLGVSDWFRTGAKRPTRPLILALLVSEVLHRSRQTKIVRPKITLNNAVILAVLIVATIGFSLIFKLI